MYRLSIEDRATDARARLILADLPVWEFSPTDETRAAITTRAQKHTARRATAQPRPRARYTSKEKRKRAK